MKQTQQELHSTAREQPSQRRPRAQRAYLFGLTIDQFFLTAKGVLVAALLIFVVVVFRGDSGKTVDFDSLRIALSQDATIAALTEEDRSYLSKTWGLDGTDYEAYLVYKADGVLDVSELLIVKTSDAEQQENLALTLQTYLDTLLSTWQSYGTTQYDTLRNALILQKGDCFIFAVSENIDQWEEEILACIR